MHIYSLDPGPALHYMLKSKAWLHELEEGLLVLSGFVMRELVCSIVRGGQREEAAFCRDN